MVRKNHGQPPMKISTPPSPSLAHAPRVQQGSQLQHLQVGQLLRASVVDVLSPNLARLAIGQEQVMARTGGGLVAGQELDLKVAQLKPEIQLQLAQQRSTESARISLLRAALPQQQPLGSVLSQIAGLMPQAPAGAASLLAPLQGLLAQLQPLNQLNGAMIQAALAQSGLDFEHKLLQQKADGRPDAKGQLLSLLAGARHLPDGPWARALLPLLEAALARVVMHQAGSLPAAEGAPPEWRFDLPLQLADEPHTVTARLGQEAPGGEASEERAWHLSLRFELGEWGLMHAELRWVQETLSSSFWCEQARTLQAVYEKLPVLADWLSQSGITLGDLVALQGLPPAEARKAPPRSGLLDERA